MIRLCVTREWHEKFVQEFLCHTHVNVKFKLSCTVWATRVLHASTEQICWTTGKLHASE